MNPISALLQPRRERRVHPPQGIRNRLPSLLSSVLLLALISAAPRAALPDGQPRPLTAGEFADVIGRLSESGGYFWNDNFVSNEASYLHPLTMLRELGIEGGIYLGVGPNQNLTYIAKLRPRYAFIIDIRRQNLLQHLFFKALFHYSRSPDEYLSLLLSRRAAGKSPSENPGIERLVLHYRGTDPDPRLYRKNSARIRLFLREAGRIQLTGEDFAAVDRIHRAFYQRGVSIKYDYIPVPTYGEFLLERDLNGRQQNFLNSAGDFRFLKRLHEENRIIPVVGDFAGPHALREVGRFLQERGERVTVFYTSNVEQYLMRTHSWKAFMENVRELPFDDRAVFIRAYWSNRIPHPEGIAGYRFTQILQWARPFISEFSGERPYTYWDIITTGTIKLH